MISSNGFLGHSQMRLGITFPNDTRTSNDDKEKLEEKIIRLITRVLFVWFIKHKGLVPNNLFEVEKIKHY